MINTAARECLDVADWNTADGATIRGWKCCCSKLHFCGDCQQPEKNFNQVFDLDHSVIPPRIITGKQMGGKCLVTSPAGIVTKTCSEVQDGSWLTYSTTLSPPIRLGNNLSLCFSSENQPLPPGPPGPPAPYTPVPQACAPGGNTTSLPFCNTSLPIDVRISDLLSRMTLNEKLGQLVGGIGGGVTPAIPSLGIPPYQ